MIDRCSGPDKLETALRESPRPSLMKSLYSRSFCAVWLGLCFCSVALAQDPLKVEPTHYKLAFENEHVQVVNVHYGPHEKSGLHAHMGGVVVVLTAGDLRFTDENGKMQETSTNQHHPRAFRPFQ